MEFSVCMVVKDEVNNIEPCLDPLLKRVDDILVLDTGSSDGTVELLFERYGIRPLHGTLDAGRCYPLCDFRNQLSARARHPWVLHLDADERLTENDIRYLQSCPDDPSVAGYFMRWNTYTSNRVLQDYKLPLHRRGIERRGLVHDNAQFEIRRQGLHAAWLDGVELGHWPDAARQADKMRRRVRRLRCAIELESGWIRYHWFLGYMLFREGCIDEAIGPLEAAASSRSLAFPVESLNSHMVLAEIRARVGDVAGAQQLLRAALAFHRVVGKDFEVRFNFRLASTLEHALWASTCSRLDEVRSYDFAY
jgi:hypothetical protein